MTNSIEKNLSQTMHNPLVQATKGEDLSKAMASKKSTSLAPDQISPEMDKRENNIIKKRRFKES